MPKAEKRTPPDIEKSLAELEQIVNELENGELPLEKAMAHFERGVGLTRDCQKALTEVEQRVSVLLEDSGLDDEPEPFGD